jgi:hypothetical protein
MNFEPVMTIIMGGIYLAGIMEVALLAITIVLLAMGHWGWAFLPGLPALVVLGLLWWAKR